MKDNEKDNNRKVGDEFMKDKFLILLKAVVKLNESKQK